MRWALVLSTVATASGLVLAPPPCASPANHGRVAWAGPQMSDAEGEEPPMSSEALEAALEALEVDMREGASSADGDYASSSTRKSRGSSAPPWKWACRSCRSRRTGPSAR